MDLSVSKIRRKTAASKHLIAQRRYEPRVLNKRSAEDENGRRSGKTKAPERKTGSGIDFRCSSGRNVGEKRRPTAALTELSGLVINVPRGFNRGRGGFIFSPAPNLNPIRLLHRCGIHGRQLSGRPVSPISRYSLKFKLPSPPLGSISGFVLGFALIRFPNELCQLLSSDSVRTFVRPPRLSTGLC